MAALLAGDPAVVAARPEPARWSALEYGAHLRDVLISLRERTLTASIEDHPTGAPIHRDERVDLGFYSLDDPATVAAELRAAAGSTCARSPRCRRASRTADSSTAR